MAKTISAEELQLRKRARRRLIGAIALVTIVAVFLPMFLDHEPKQPRQDINIQIPSPDSGTFTSKIVPMSPGTPAPKTAAKPPPETPAKTPPTAKPELAQTAPAAGKPIDPAAPVHDPEAAPPKAPAAAAKPVPAPPVKSQPVPQGAPAPPADGKGGFVVQVAALSDASKAKQMQEQIAAAGIKSYTEIVPTTKGSVTRVRAGPYASREEAEKARTKLKDLGLNGNLVPK